MSRAAFLANKMIGSGRFARRWRKIKLCTAAPMHLSSPPTIRYSDVKEKSRVGNLDGRTDGRVPSASQAENANESGRERATQRPSLERRSAAGLLVLVCIAKSITAITVKMKGKTSTAVSGDFKRLICGSAMLIKDCTCSPSWVQQLRPSASRTKLKDYTNPLPFSRRSGRPTARGRFFSFISRGKVALRVNDRSEKDGSCSGPATREEPRDEEGALDRSAVGPRRRRRRRERSKKGRRLLLLPSRG